MTKQKKITIKIQKFIEYYIQTGNATASAKRAGYSERSAHTIGYNLLNKVKYAYVQDAIEARKKVLFDVISKDTHKTIQTIDNLANIDVRLFFDDAGNLKSPANWTEAQGRCVQSFRIVRSNIYAQGSIDCPHCNISIPNKDKAIKTKEEIVQFTLTDRRDPVKMIATHQNLIVDKHEHKHTVDDLATKLREGRERARIATEKKKEQNQDEVNAEYEVIKDQDAPIPAQQPEIRQPTIKDDIDVF